MNTLVIFLLTFVAIDCNAFEDIDLKFSQSSPPDDPDPTFAPTTPQTTDTGKLEQKCSEEMALLKKNMSQLLSAFFALRDQFDHMKQHLVFHEKALKHIAVWGHKPVRHHSHGMESNNDLNIDFKNSTLNEQNNETVRDIRAHKDRHQNHNRVKHRHRHDNHNHHHHHHHHNHHDHHSGNGGCNQCSQSRPPHQKIGESQFEEKLSPNNSSNSDKDKDSSEESSEEVVSPLLTTLAPESDPKIDSDNGSKSLNDSYKAFSSGKSPKGLTKPSIEEQLYFQSMESEFKEWFDNMLNDIHRQSSQRRSNWLHNNAKDRKRSDQSAIDEMDNALNSEDLVFATCDVKPNRHIALLNQQEVEGTINMWQLRHNRGPLHMHIRLKGFKVNNHFSGKSRRRRESILMPVEQESDNGSPPMGSSHSHALHIHEFGNLSRDCQSVGNHYNPLNLAHGGPYDVVRHVGDLGNIRCDKNGEIDAEYSYSQVSLMGPHSVVNRSLVIHSNADDYGRKPNSPSSLQSGNSGVRIACCLIQEVRQPPKDLDSESSIGSVAGPVVSSKRKRESSEPMIANGNRFPMSRDSTFSKAIENSDKYENRGEQ